MSINDLPPAALRAALKTGTAEWGQWGSAKDHALYVQRISVDVVPMHRRRMCRCGCRKRQTHIVKANGVGIAWGCEMHAHRSKRDLENPSPPVLPSPFREDA